MASVQPYKRRGRKLVWRVTWKVAGKHNSRQFSSEVEAVAFRDTLPPSRPRPVYANDQERIHRNVTIDLVSGCWNWNQYRHIHEGYGYISRYNERFLAHRFAYEALVGPIPEGLTIDHLCRNRACVNPRHLEPVTCLENIRRARRAAERAAA